MVNTEYTEYEMGRALAYFINNIDTLESHIGDFKKAIDKKGAGYRVTGYQVETGGSYADILSTLDTGIEIEGKFTGNGEKTAFQLLKSYLNTLDETAEEYKKKTLDRFKEICSNRRLIAPFKVGDECLFKSQSTSREESTKIVSVLWSMDKEAGKFKAKLLVRIVTPAGVIKTQKLDFEDYGKLFKLTELERVLKTSKIDRKLIKVDRFGIIHPILIKDKNIKIAVDSLNVYIVMEDGVSIIGRFDSNGALHESKIAKTLSKHKAYKHLKDNLSYISKHLRYIAPYGLIDSTEVAV